MASKKVKGQKVDLASLMGSGSGDKDLVLPSAPDPNREPSDRRRRGPGDGGGRERGNDRMGGGGGRGDDWTRDNRSFDRTSSRFDPSRSDEPWRNSGPSRGYSGDRGAFGRSGPAPERPEHLRLKLDPPKPRNIEESGRNAADNIESRGTSEVSQNQEATSEDKWSKVFANKGFSSQPRYDDRSDRFSSGGNRRPGGGFGGSSSGGNARFDRPSDGSRYGGRTASEDLDPRFVGKFSGHSLSSGQEEASIPQSAQTKTGQTLADSGIVLVKSSEDKVIEDARKAAKAAKAAERAEAERKAREEKEAAIEKAKADLEAARDAEKLAFEAAAAAYATGLKGVALADYITGLASKPSGAALVTEVLGKLDDPISVRWMAKSEFGAPLKILVKDDVIAQSALLHAVQAHFYRQKFPKMDVKGKQENAIEVVFKLLYSNELVDPAGFQAWADDDDDRDGKITAVVQTTSFFLFLNEDDEGEEDEEDEDEEEIDAPRLTI